MERRGFPPLAVAALAVLGLATQAGAAGPLTALRVPHDYPTVQDAVDAASPGDQIRVGPGAWCGATVTTRVDLVGEGGATIVGCPAPALFGILRIGFFLPNGGASGTTIRHFVFDGLGVSNAELDPLAFAVFARDADDVVVRQNHVRGSVQAVTNTRGSRWRVEHNVIEGLTAFTCDGFCGGGDAIVFQSRTPTPPQPAAATDNVAVSNVVTGRVPDGLDEFSLVGILAIAQNSAIIANNRIAIAGNALAAATGQAIVITDHCCGDGQKYADSINSVIVNNDGRGSQFAVVIEQDLYGGTGNSAGTVLRGNLGLNDINGSAGPVRNRSIHTLIEFP